MPVFFCPASSFLVVLKVVDPYDNLENFVDMEPGVWVDQPYRVAQGAGLFSHVDRRKYWDF
jgi:hypothetical protein